VRHRRSRRVFRSVSRGSQGRLPCTCSNHRRATIGRFTRTGQEVRRLLALRLE
jgi:hypothetical protein